MPYPELLIAVLIGFFISFCAICSKHSDDNWELPSHNCAQCTGGLCWDLHLGIMAPAPRCERAWKGWSSLRESLERYRVRNIILIVRGHFPNGYVIWHTLFIW